MLCCLTQASPGDGFFGDRVHALVRRFGGLEAGESHVPLIHLQAHL